MANFYTTKKTINGVEYTAQFNGISAALQAVDNSYIPGTQNTSVKRLSKTLFDNVIVEPKLTCDDFGKKLIGTTKSKTINGVEYTAQFKGLSAALEAVDDSYIDGTQNTSVEKLSKYLFENIIVKPSNLTIDDFDNMDDFNDVVSFARDAMQGWGVMDEFNKVIEFAREVMQGNFRNTTDKQKSSNKESKK